MRRAVSAITSQALPCFWWVTKMVAWEDCYYKVFWWFEFKVTLFLHSSRTYPGPPWVRKTVRFWRWFRIWGVVYPPSSWASPCWRTWPLGESIALLTPHKQSSSSLHMIHFNRRESPRTFFLYFFLSLLLSLIACIFISVSFFFLHSFILRPSLSRWKQKPRITLASNVRREITASWNRDLVIWRTHPLNSNKWNTICLDHLRLATRAFETRATDMQTSTTQQPRAC